MSLVARALKKATYTVRVLPTRRLDLNKSITQQLTFSRCHLNVRLVSKKGLILYSYFTANNLADGSASGRSCCRDVTPTRHVPAEVLRMRAARALLCAHVDVPDLGEEWRELLVL